AQMTVGRADFQHTRYARAADLLGRFDLAEGTLRVGGRMEELEDDCAVRVVGATVDRFLAAPADGGEIRRIGKTLLKPVSGKAHGDPASLLSASRPPNPFVEEPGRIRSGNLRQTRAEFGT